MMGSRRPPQTVSRPDMDWWACAERVAAVGGRLVAGPGPDGGWRVRAELPVGGEELR